MLCNFIEITLLHGWSPVNLLRFWTPMGDGLWAFTLSHKTQSFLFLVPPHRYNSSILLLYSDSHTYSFHSHLDSPHSPHSHPNSHRLHPDSPHCHPDSHHSHHDSSHSNRDSPHSHPNHRITTLIPIIPTLIPRIPRIPTLTPRIPIISLFPSPDSPFHLLQIALSEIYDDFYMISFNDPICFVRNFRIMRLWKYTLI